VKGVEREYGFLLFRFLLFIFTCEIVVCVSFFSFFPFSISSLSIFLYVSPFPFCEVGVYFTAFRCFPLRLVVGVSLLLFTFTFFNFWDAVR